METERLLSLDMRPFPPDTNSLPHFIRPFLVTQTRCAWEGEPRAQQPFLSESLIQAWYPSWVDAIVELWSGPIYLEGPPRQKQRDRVLLRMTVNPGVQRKVAAARKEDLRAVRDVLRVLTTGGMPYLLEECKF